MSWPSDAQNADNFKSRVDDVTLAKLELFQSDLDVALRRKWFVMPQDSGKWIVCEMSEPLHLGPQSVFVGRSFTADHPLGLLTRADEAMKETT